MNYALQPSHNKSSSKIDQFVAEAGTQPQSAWLDGNVADTNAFRMASRSSTCYDQPRSKNRFIRLYKKNSIIDKASCCSWSQRKMFVWSWQQWRAPYSERKITYFSQVTSPKGCQYSSTTKLRPPCLQEKTRCTGASEIPRFGPWSSL